MRILKIEIVQLVIGFAFVILCALAPRMLNQLELISTELPEPFISTVSAILGFIGYLLYIRFIEKRAPHELSPSGAIQETAVGLVLGTLLVFGTIYTIKAFGLLEFGPRNANPEYLKAIFSIGLIAAIIEEILFRGLVFRFLEKWAGSAIALLVSALFFGLIHLLNPSATLLSSLAISLEAGILLAAAFMVTRRLWLPIGLHMAWNTLQAGLFGTVKTTTGMYSITTSGPAYLTGGSAGPESSITAIVLCLVVAAILLRLAIRNGNWVPMRDKTPTDLRRSD